MDFDVTRVARPAVMALTPYASARSQVSGGEGRIFLDANELGSAGEIGRYPEPQPRELRRELARRFGVGEEALFLGAGVDDAIDALVRVFCDADRDAIVVTPPTYGYYEVAARIQGARVLAAPLREPDFDLDEAALLALRAPTVKLVFICSPNNPTGNGFAPERLLRLAAELAPWSLLVVDEAYIEFSQRESLAREAASRPNLVVLRTLSKAWGLAGARLGVAIAAPAVTQLLHKVRAPYPISRPAAAAVAAALAALPDAALAERVAAVRAARDELRASLLASPLVRAVYPSDANFLLVRAADSREFLTRCARAGIVVRDRGGEPGLRSCIRVSVGTPAECAALIAALAEGTRV